MEEHKLDKPTLVKKSGDILVLKNEITVQIMLTKDVPMQFKTPYIDKTI